MPDARFFDTLAPVVASELAARIGGEIVLGGDRQLSGVAPLGSAEVGAVAFLSDRKLLETLRTTRAGVVIVSAAMVDVVPAAAGVIVSSEPQAAWARAALILHRPIGHTVMEPNAAEDASVRFGPGVALGTGARIGRGTTIGANTVIGPGVQIGRDCQIGANVSIGFALIGDGVRILAGARIGEAGFGAAGSRDGPIDIPQLGRVIIQDRVTIGANSCIDRGAYDDTIIGESSKIDNLVMIGHNVRLGRNCLLAGHVGISGSVTVGDNVMFGGRAGVGDHITIGDGARIAAGAGILADVPAGETWSGYPAKPLRQSLREAIWLSKQATRRKGEMGDG